MTDRDGAVKAEPSGDRIAVLDGLRGLAIVLVVLSHLSNAGMDLVPGLHLSGSGKFGVWLFFVLSAFLLTHQLLEVDARGELGAQAWSRYALRRFLRIYPLYIVFVLTVCVLDGVGVAPRFTGSDVLLHLTLQAGAGHLWSIPVEVKYYLALPLIMGVYIWVCRRHFGAATLLTAITIGAHQWLSTTVDGFALATYLPVFLMGSWSALLAFRLRLAGKAEEARKGAGFTMLAIVLVVLIVAMTPSLWSRVTGSVVEATYWRGDFMVFAVIWSLTVICAMAGGWSARGVFGNRALRYCGAISFGAYLWHPLLIVAASSLTEMLPTARAILVLMSTVLVAWMSHVLIEGPSSKLLPLEKEQPL